VGVVDIDDGLRRLAADSGFQERIAYILLRSCAELLADGSESTRKHMQAALMHWFGASNLSSLENSDSRRSADLDSVVDVAKRKLTWREAMERVGANPEDYSAKGRLLKRLRETCERTWAERFGESIGNPFRGGPDAER